MWRKPGRSMADLGLIGTAGLHRADQVVKHPRDILDLFRDDMGDADITPDETVLWDGGFVNINLTLVTTWAVMLLLIVGAWAITRRLREALALVDVRVLDHFVVAAGESVSFAERGLI